MLIDEEVADVLDISIGGVKELVAGGVLHPHGDIGRRFEAAEVYQLRDHAAPDELLPGEELPDALPEPAPLEPGGRRVLDVGDVATLYRVDPKTVARWDKKGKLPPSFRTPGGHRRFYEDEILPHLAATRPRPPPP